MNYVFELGICELGIMNCIGVVSLFCLISQKNKNTSLQAQT